MLLENVDQRLMIGKYNEGVAFQKALEMLNSNKNREQLKVIGTLVISPVRKLSEEEF